MQSTNKISFYQDPKGILKPDHAHDTHLRQLNHHHILRIMFLHNPKKPLLNPQGEDICYQLGKKMVDI